MWFIFKLYNHVMQEWTDPKTRDWKINKPTILAPVIIIYLVFCVYVGPAFMKNRRPFKINKIIQIYNISQVIMNTVLAVAGIICVRHYNFLCQPMNYTLDPKEVRVTIIAWCYCASKLYDLLDTVFFILRKKFNQVTLLHLYHHVTMGGPFIFATNFCATGHVVLPFGMNMIVHIFMYYYYFLASMGPEYKKHLWWKRHLTELQLVQFCIAFAHSVGAFFIGCGVPLLIIIYFMGQSLFFAFLFGQFYYYAYVKKPVAKEETVTQAVNGINQDEKPLTSSEIGNQELTPTKVLENGAKMVSEHEADIKKLN